MKLVIRLLHPAMHSKGQRNLVHQTLLQVVVYCLTSFIFGLSLLDAANLALIALVCLFVFSFSAYVLLNFATRRVASRVSELKKDEGLFRFQHTRIKKNSESIAFYNGHSLEFHKMKLLFDSVLRSARSVIKGQMVIDCIAMFFA